MMSEVISDRSIVFRSRIKLNGTHATPNIKNISQSIAFTQRDVLFSICWTAHDRPSPIFC